MGVWYTTREDVKRSLDMNETARNDVLVDRAIEAASRAVEAFLHRTFAPVLATRYFDWPNPQYARAWRLWLDENELISVTTLSSGGTVIPSTDYFLEPVNSGPPYDRIEIDIDTSSAFATEGTHQRAVVVTGLWGYTADETAVGTIAEALDASETDVDIDGRASAQLGVGSVLKVDSERMLVTDRSALSSGQTLQSPIDAVDSDVTVQVTTGSEFAVGETILLDSERMLVVDIAGNALTVRRAWDGSVLAAHTGSTVYAYRTLTVTRGALGTTAATHLTAAPLLRWDVPGALLELTTAEALNNLQQALGGYSGSTGADQSKRITVPIALEDLRRAARSAVGRKARVGAV